MDTSDTSNTSLLLTHLTAYPSNYSYILFQICCTRTQDAQWFHPVLSPKIKVKVGVCHCENAVWILDATLMGYISGNSCRIVISCL